MPKPLTSSEFLDWFARSAGTMSPDERHRQIRLRCERDASVFARRFFEHLVSRPFSAMHRDLIALYEDALRAEPLGLRPRRRLAVAAPRGAAKTTLKSLILPIHATLYGHERYIAILSATLRQARQRLRNIKAEFDTNAGLQEVFSEEVARRGRWTMHGININDVQIDIFSAGTELRGITHRQWRPTLVVLDDIEDSVAVRSPDQRERLLDWYNEVIENLGDSYTAIEIVGTLLHPGSLLATLLRRPDFESRLYRSVVRFAERADLWDQWTLRYADLDDSDRAATARAFFEERREEMLAGAEVLWPEKEDYYTLMTQLTAMGRKAFFKEKQNEPGSADGGLFHLERTRRFRLEEGVVREILLPGQRILDD